MRDTKYATELARASIAIDGDEGRIERILVKKNRQEEIRFSWWKNGRFVTRPLDLPENQLLALMGRAVHEDVFTPAFRLKLRELLGQKTRGTKKNGGRSGG